MTGSGKTIERDLDQQSRDEAESVPLDEGMPEINPDKVCFVIVKARELAGAEEGNEALSGSNESDDRFASILTTRGVRATEHEVRDFIDALDDDEQTALVALMWIGRGDYPTEEWPSAVADAWARRSGPVGTYLLGTPLLADYLEIALDQFGESCLRFEEGRL